MDITQDNPRESDLASASTNSDLNNKTKKTECDKEDGDKSPERRDTSLPSQITSAQLLPHNELIQFFKKSIKDLIEIDPLLKDLRPDVTLDEVNSMLALENGKAITVYVEREVLKPWRVIVPLDSSLHQLKLALKRAVSTELQRRKKTKKISWRYIWRTYWLCLDGVQLTNDSKKLRDYGIKNKSTLTFLKKKIKGCNNI